DLVSLTFRAITALSLALSLAISSFTASATQAYEDQLRSAPDAALESVFWECDYTATIRMLEPDVAAVCSAINEELKVRKFEGDFEQMLDWWATHKTAEHRKVAERIDGRLG
ncbi:MAG: hypothetical protein ACREBN_02505, partial [Burkholderiaceae bacterium]